MNFVLKLLWVASLAVVMVSVLATVSRFYSTGRLIMFFAGVIALLYISSMLFNTILILFFKGA